MAVCFGGGDVPARAADDDRGGVSGFEAVQLVRHGGQFPRAFDGLVVRMAECRQLAGMVQGQADAHRQGHGRQPFRTFGREAAGRGDAAILDRALAVQREGVAVLPIIEEHVHAGGQLRMQRIGIIEGIADQQGKLLMAIVQVGNQFHWRGLNAQNMVFRPEPFEGQTVFLDGNAAVGPFL